MGTLDELAGLRADETSQRIWVKSHYKSFDGLRGVAIMMVFACHYMGFWGLYKIGNSFWVGVDLFFVLSGFLITGILYDSVAGERYIKTFYLRRSLRIFPIYYGFFLLLFVLTPVLHLQYSATILSFVVYVGNLIVPFLDLSKENPTMISVLHHGRLIEVGNVGSFWSLCVEEQFYLIWPAVIWFVRDRVKLMRLCVVVCIAVLVGRILLYRYASAVHVQQLLLSWSTYTRGDTLMIGAWFALYLRGVRLSAIQLRRLAWSLILPAFTCLAIGTYHWHYPYLFLNPFVITIGFTLIGLVAAGILLLALDEDSLIARLLQWRWLGRLGTISYGFYLYHMLPIGLWQYFAEIHPAWAWSIPVLAFLLTLALATLSFHFVESWFLRLKNRLALTSANVKIGSCGLVSADSSVTSA
jgi:peptidoglycan/LPS O-acetylase OafA/YrhL